MQLSMHLTAETVVGNQSNDWLRAWAFLIDTHEQLYKKLHKELHGVS